MTQDTLDNARARAGARPEAKSGILEIEAYKPGKFLAEGFEHPVKLSSNENVLGCSPKARDAYLAAADTLHIYPDSRAARLRTAVAQRYSLEPDRLVFGDGTDEVLHLLNQVFLEPGHNIVMGQYGFSAYEIGARACQAEVRKADEPGYRLSVDKMLELVDERTRLVFITQPGNPTGSFLDRSEVQDLRERLPADVVLIMDGAYAEFATDPGFEDGFELARASSNVVVTRTFSKIYGLAGLRIGWAYCPAHIAEAVDRIRAPFNTSTAAQEAAIAALGDEAFRVRSIEHVGRWRNWLIQQLGGLGLEVAPSSANFVLVGFAKSPGKTAPEAEAWLARHGYIVRGVGNYGLPDHLRITIGLEDHNRAVIDLLSQFLGR